MTDVDLATGNQQLATMEPLVAYISASALRANWSLLRGRAGPGCRLCAMVKANAYGHGVEPVTRTLVAAGADFLAVARLEEAQHLRSLGLAQPVLLCEPAVGGEGSGGGGEGYFRDRLEAICRVPGIRVTVADAAGAASLGATAARLGVCIAVHLKIDTGMGRGGAMPSSADAIRQAVQAAPSLDLEGVYTHLATADETDAAFAREQLAAFARVVEELAAHRCRPRYVHAANSAGLARFGSPLLTLARPGLALYGYQPHAAGCADVGRLALKPVLRLVGRLIFVKDLPAGHSVGYGRSWRADRASRIGLVPIGYGDGYSRRFGNRAVMQVAGRDVPVVGRISMDLTTIDLTGLPAGGRNIRPGEPVTIISERASDANSVEGLARLAETIPYEITCRIGQRVRRELVDSFA